MDQRMINANDPTSFGGETIKAREKSAQDYYMPGDEEYANANAMSTPTSKKNRRRDTVTI